MNSGGAAAALFVCFFLSSFLPIFALLFLLLSQKVLCSLFDSSPTTKRKRQKTKRLPFAVKLSPCNVPLSFFPNWSWIWSLFWSWIWSLPYLHSLQRLPFQLPRETHTHRARERETRRETTRTRRILRS